MPAPRVLCVDDDQQILLMLPKILELNGYEVVTAGSISEALNIITSQQFDVLVADLNMGHVADGFTVVHAMRRVNPECINFILTGYPAFESALQALRAQVDDYLSKPSDIPKLVQVIQDKLQARTTHSVHPVERLSSILRHNVDTIVARTLVSMKSHPDLAALPLSDEELLDDLESTLRELADHLDSALPNEGNDSLLRAGRLRGETRQRQQYPIELIVANHRILEQVIDNVVYENLLGLNLSYLLLDMNKLNDAMLLQLEESVKAYVQTERRT